MINQKDHNKIAWDIIDKMFSNDNNYLVNHHLSSYNSFFSDKIKNVLKDNNPLTIFKDYNDDPKIVDYNLKCYMYFGGKSGSKIYYGKPILYEEDNEHIMFPNEARLKNKTYGFNINYDIDVDFEIRIDEEIIKKSLTLEKITLGMFPIMLHSNLCMLKDLTPEARFYNGECINDKGGYFIIDGKEKVIVCQEQFANNAIYITDKLSDEYSYGAEIRSVSENTSVVPYNGVYEIEKGCRISLNSHKPKLIDLKFWNSLKDEFGLTCAHLNVEGKFKGCIYDYLRDSACP